MTRFYYTNEEIETAKEAAEELMEREDLTLSESLMLGVIASKFGIRNVKEIMEDYN